MMPPDLVGDEKVCRSVVRERKETKMEREQQHIVAWLSVSLNGGCGDPTMTPLG